MHGMHGMYGMYGKRGMCGIHDMRGMCGMRGMRVCEKINNVVLTMRGKVQIWQFRRDNFPPLSG